MNIIMPMARLPLGRHVSSRHRTRGLVAMQTTLGRGLIAYRRDKWTWKPSRESTGSGGENSHNDTPCGPYGRRQRPH
jgi:ribosomal protein L34